jgi:hypothetical protein
MRARFTGMEATNPHEILIRRAYADDDLDVTRLAVTDSAQTPPAPLLVAEIDGVLRVALSLTDGSVIADPFIETADVVELLRVHAASASVRARKPGLRPRVARRLALS